MIRNYILTDKNCEFAGSLDAFCILNSLKTFLNWIINGPKSKIASDCTKKQEVNKSI